MVTETKHRNWFIRHWIVSIIIGIIIIGVIGSVFVKEDTQNSQKGNGLKLINPQDSSAEEDTTSNTQIQATQNTPSKQKVKSATLSIDKIQIQVANLYPTRVTVTNTGDISISPKFDLYVYDGSDKEVCSGSPLFDEIRTLSAGEKQTGEISIMGCMFEKDGDYTLKVDLLDSDYTKLDSDTKDFTVDYWNQFNIG